MNDIIHLVGGHRVRKQFKTENDIDSKTEMSSDGANGGVKKLKKWMTSFMDGLKPPCLETKLECLCQP